MKRADRERIQQIVGAVAQGEAAEEVPEYAGKQAADMQRQAGRWLRYKGIQGLAVGTKTTGGRDTGEPCLKLYVARKLPRARLKDPAPAYLPDLDGGGDIPVDVEAIGKFHFHNRLHPGASLANISRSTGTLGLVVKPRRNGSGLGLLSCHHVLSPLQPGATSVCSPAPLDAPSGVGRPVGEYWYSYPLFEDPVSYPNTADAALAVLRSTEAWTNNVPDIGAPAGVTDDFKAGDYVRIFGRSSGWSMGEIKSVGAYTDVWQRTPRGEVRYGFTGQVLCTPYGQPGDSGAIVFDAFNRVIGMHIAGTSRLNFFTPIRPILDYFQVDIAQAEDAETVTPTSAGAGSAEPASAAEAFSPARYATRPLTEHHGIFGSVSWRLTDRGLEVDGQVNGTPGNLVTVPNVWAQYSTYIKHAAREFDVPVELIVACMCTESRGRADAQRMERGYISDRATPSRVSIGLMQTLISTARLALGDASIDRAWLLEPLNSIRAGTAYIAQQKVHTEFDPPLVACAYSAGGVYENTSSGNRWKMRQFPIGSGDHTDRFVLWFNDVFRFFVGWNFEDIPQDSFFADIYP